MEIIKINEYDFIANIDWKQNISKKELNSKFSSFAKEFPLSKFGLICNYRDDNVIGFLDKSINKKPKQKSAAAYLANANAKEYIENDEEKNLAWICVEELDDGRYWIGGALNGLPILDDIVGTNDIKQTVNSHISTINAISTNGKKNVITIFIPNEGMNIAVSKEVNQLEDVTVNRKNFSTIIEDVKYKVILRKTSNLSSIFMFLAIMGVVIGGGFFAYDYYEQIQADEYQSNADKEAARSKEELKKIQKKYEEDKKIAIQKSKELAIEKMNKKLSNPIPSDVIENWYDIIKVEKNTYQGWDRGSIVCEMVGDQTPECIYELKRKESEDIGTVKSLAEQFNYQNITVDFDGKKALVKRNNDVKLSKINGDYKELSDFKWLQFQFDTLSKLQMLELSDIKTTFKQPTIIESEIELPNPPKGIKQKKEDLEKIIVGLEEGEFSIKGKDLFKLKALAKNLKEIKKPLAIDTIVIKTSGNTEMDWTINGRYYIQSDKVESNLDTIETKIPKSEINKNSR